MSPLKKSHCGVTRQTTWHPASLRPTPRIVTDRLTLCQMQSENVSGQSANLGLDSITIGQLRSMVNSAPKPKVLVVYALGSNLIPRCQVAGHLRLSLRR